MVVFGKLLFAQIYNSRLIKAYERGDYSVNANNLKVANIYQPYIAYYNSGNVYYKRNDFDNAIKEYNSALKCRIPEKKECPIRINLALAIIGTIPDDYDSPDNIDATIATLKEARDVLLFQGCATDSDDGHSKDAQTLKDEIDDLIDKLENPEDSDEDGDDDEDKEDNEEGQDDQDENQDEEDQEDAREQEIEEQLMQMQQDAYEEREEELQSLDDYSIFNYDGDIW